ncbi:MAG TPA: hypothetical protein PKD54_10005 [Pirellulaceae bacterium]|nr:hypothetical protein [Pirellulaceae bacterium]
MKWWAWLVIVVLLIAHQDYWLWHSPQLVAGFIPAGFAWHMGISIAACVAWWAIATWSWPAEYDRLEPFSDSNQETGDAREGTRR